MKTELTPWQVQRVVSQCKEHLSFWSIKVDELELDNIELDEDVSHFYKVYVELRNKQGRGFELQLMCKPRGMAIVEVSTTYFL